MSETKSWSSEWRSPSNIAIVKYWGKKSEGIQLPANPSISFTLDACHTQTKVVAKASDKISLVVRVDGKITPSFEPKIRQFLTRISDDLPMVLNHHFEIETTNTFPHSSGIASSASGMSALALCLLSIDEQLGNFHKDFKNKASHLARLGSGSACRSLFGPMAVWGESDVFTGSNDQYAVEFNNIHDHFKAMNDVILLVHKGQKSVSSTVGHDLIGNHPFKEKRFEQAHEHMQKLQLALINGDYDSFISIMELEAFTLHALMMSSSEPYLLMMPETVAIIHAIREFRAETGLPVGFTLDAGANVHCLFPESIKTEVMSFVDNQLMQYCEGGSYICDKIGLGSIKLN